MTRALTKSIWVKSYLHMLKDVILRNKSAALPRPISGPVTMAVLSLLLIGAIASVCLTVMAFTDRIAATGNELAEARQISSAEVKTSAATKPLVVERQPGADPSNFASKKFEPLMLLMLGTMLLSIGAAIKLVMTRNPR